MWKGTWFELQTMIMIETQKIGKLEIYLDKLYTPFLMKKKEEDLKKSNTP